MGCLWRARAAASGNWGRFVGRSAGAWTCSSPRRPERRGRVPQALHLRCHLNANIKNRRQRARLRVVLWVMSAPFPGHLQSGAVPTGVRASADRDVKGEFHRASAAPGARSLAEPWEGSVSVTSAQSLGCVTWAPLVRAGGASRCDDAPTREAVHPCLVVLPAPAPGRAAAVSEEGDLVEWPGESHGRGPGPPPVPTAQRKRGAPSVGARERGSPCVCPRPPGGLEQVPGGRSLPEGRGTAELGTLQPRLCGIVTRLQGSNKSGTGTRTRISAGDEPPGIGVENRWTPEMTCAEGKPKSLRRGGRAPCGPVPGLGLVRDPRVLAPLPGLRPRPHLHGSYQPPDTPGNAGRRPAPSESLSWALAARPTER